MELTLQLDTLSGDPTKYIGFNRTCRLVGGASVVYTATTTNAVTVTLSDGTTTAGTFTIAAGSAAGTVDLLSYSAAVELGPTLPLKVVCSGTPGAGAIILTLQFSEGHAA